MKNTDTWTFAHETIGKLWLYGGMILELNRFVSRLSLLWIFQIKSGDWNWYFILCLRTTCVYFLIQSFYIEEIKRNLLINWYT